MSDEEKPPVSKWLVTALTALFIAGLGAGIGAWRDVAVLTARIEPFITAGPRWTARDGLENRKLIQECQRGLHDFREEYRTHVAWGKQWVKGSERRIERLETK